jgi:hypothetical protein
MLREMKRLCALALCLLPIVCGAADAQPKRLAMLGFELIDQTEDRASDAAQQARLQKIDEQLRQEFIDHHFYTVMDLRDKQPMINDMKSRFALYDCNGCDVDLGKALGADRVLTGWVQKVSNLILNINIQIKDVSSGETVLVKSVDIRSNTDRSWERGVRYMVQSMVDKGQGNR